MKKKFVQHVFVSILTVICGVRCADAVPSLLDLTTAGSKGWLDQLQGGWL